MERRQTDTESDRQRQGEEGRRRRTDRDGESIAGQPWPVKPISRSQTLPTRTNGSADPIYTSTSHFPVWLTTQQTGRPSLISPLTLADHRHIALGIFDPAVGGLRSPEKKKEEERAGGEWFVRRGVVCRVFPPSSSYARHHDGLCVSSRRTRRIPPNMTSHG